MHKVAHVAEYVSVEKLSLHPMNPRKINEHQLEVLCQSIKDNPAYFEARPILCNKDYVIFAGNMRFIAAKKSGLTEVPVVVMDVTPEKEKELMIRDNRQNGTWDQELLAGHFEMQELQSWGFEKFELGFLDKENLEGMDKDSLEKTMDSYMEGNIKQVVLYFKAEDFDSFLARLDKVMETEGVESHTDAVLRLLDKYEGN